MTYTVPTTREIPLPDNSVSWSELSPDEQAQKKGENTHFYIQDLYCKNHDAAKFISSYTDLYGQKPFALPRIYAVNPWDAGIHSYPVFGADGEFAHLSGGFKPGETPELGGSDGDKTTEDVIVYDGDELDPNISLEYADDDIYDNPTKLPPTEREIDVPQEYNSSHFKLQHKMCKREIKYPDFVQGYISHYGVPPVQVPRLYARHPDTGQIVCYPHFEKGIFVCYNGDYDYPVYEGDPDDPNIAT